MRTALIIDDARVPINYYIRALRQRGWVVTQCFDADRALSMAETLKPDLIVLDVMMPTGHSYAGSLSGDGRWTGKLLYEDLRDRYPNALIVVLTALPSSEARELFQAAQVARIVSKADCPPIELAKLVDALFEKPMEPESAS